MATYYVDPNGLDANNGTSPPTAWKTLAKVNGASFLTGDSVLFLAGASFAGQLAAASGVTYGAYGAGANPVINGSGQTQCILALSVNNITLQNLRLTTGGTYGLAADTVNGLVMNGLEIDHSQSSGIILGNGTQNVTVSGCLIHDNGSAASGDRNGIGIGGGGAAPHDITIQGNTIYNNHADNIRVSMTSAFNTPFNITVKGNTIYGSAAGAGVAADAAANLSVTYNLIYNNAAGQAVYIVPASISSHVENVQAVIYNNTIVNNQWGILATNGGGGTFNVVAKNNLLENNGTAGTTAEMAITTPTTWASDNNLVYHPAGGNFMYAGSFMPWATWKTTIAPSDSHSVNADPKLNSDYTLLPGSPAIGAGAFIAGVSTSNPPNIGAFGATVFTPVTELAGFFNNVALAASTPTQLVAGLGHWDVAVVNTGAAAIYVKQAATVAAGDPASYTLPPNIPLQFTGYGPSGFWMLSVAAGSASVRFAPRGG